MAENTSTWKTEMSRDEILELWMEAAKSRKDHAYLCNRIHAVLVDKVHQADNSDNSIDIKSISAKYPQYLPSKEDLAETCTQIRDGLLRQVKKQRALADNDLIREMITSAEARIPALLVGATTGGRANYANMFTRMLNNAAAEIKGDDKSE